MKDKKLVFIIFCLITFIMCFLIYVYFDYYKSGAYRVINFPLKKSEVIYCKKKLKKQKGDDCGLLLYSHYLSLKKYDDANKYLEITANGGNDDAGIILARKYANGEISIEKNLPQSIMILEKYKNKFKATNMFSDISPKFKLAQIYASGTYGPEYINKDKAVRYLKELIEEDKYLPAYLELGNIEFENKNYKVAFVLFKKAALKGYVPAIKPLIRCYENGWGCEKNPEMVKKLNVVLGDKFYSYQEQDLNELFNSGGL